jgi:hypothetical protein
MEVFLEILKYTFPALLMLLLTYLMLSNFLANEENRRNYLLKKEVRKNALPVRLQAYERLTLFLERITPNSLLVRVPAKKLTSQEYQTLLLRTIRDEFEHNLRQQIYISEEAWHMVVTAKSATVSIINKISSEVDPNTPALELSRKILEHTLEIGTFPTRSAIHFMKTEIKSEI